MSDSWFETINGPKLAQGDLLLDCPVYRPIGTEVVEGITTVKIVEETHNVIVLSQTCDLDNSKIEEVLLARVVAYTKLVAEDGATNPALRSTRFKDSLVDNTLLPYLLLHEKTDPPILDWTIVDFHNLFTLPIVIVNELALNSGDRPRLIAPYTEHLAQSFAKYMMRVALPIGLKAFT